MKFDWEDVYTRDHQGLLQVGTWRARTIGGWIVNTMIGAGAGSIRGSLSTSTVFVPDKNHLWKITDGSEDDIKLKTIHHLDLMVRTARVLEAENILLIGDLIKKTQSDLIRTPNFGNKSLRDVQQALATHGLSLLRYEDSEA